jgi:tetratricopeptide (TPR) repeat protein
MKMKIGLWSWALLVALLNPAPVEGQRGRAQVEEGNRLYSEGRFEEAHGKYLEALLEDPESPLIRFNDGNALYQNQDFQGALERFREAAESGDPALVSPAWYNLGNALYREQELAGSLEAYKQALRANPSDSDAKHNLERVLEQLQEQEEQDQQQEGEDQQEQQEEGEDDHQEPDQGEGQPQESPQTEGEEPPPGDENQGEQPSGEDASPEEEPREGQGEPQPQPGEMTPEEAQRLLDAIREDPGDVNRKRAPATGKRPRKEW